MTSLQRLLKYPHGAVFDTSPHAELVLRIRSEAGLAWVVADEVLTVTAGDRELTYDLSALTIGQLAAALAADGIEVTPITPEFAGYSAAVLIDGRRNQADSNGDHLTGFRNPLWSLYSAYNVVLRRAGRQIGEAMRQMVITDAEGEWLDLWGTLYNTPRLNTEDDADYAQRIPQEAFRVRVNALAIEQAILDATGKDVRIEEPWGSMFRLDESALSGEQKFYDGSRIGYHLIRPVSKLSIDWSDVMPIIERNRAAGVVILDPEIRLGSLVDASINGSLWLGIRSERGASLQLWTDSRLDYMALSDEEITRNWDVMISSVSTIANFDALLDPVSIAAVRSIAMASITLSDGLALGDENAIFPRAELTQLGGEMVVSDNLELSSLDQAPVYRPVDRVTLATNASGELDTGGAVGAGVAPTEIRAAFVVADVLGSIQTGLLHNTFVATTASGGERIWSAVKDISGYTWADVGIWADMPWNTSKATIGYVEAATEDLWQYANYRLGDDL